MAFLSLLAILSNRAFNSFSPLPFTSLLITAVCKASSKNHFAFLYFFFLGMVLTPGVGDGQGSLACCDSWDLKESDTTERLN